MFSWSRRGIKVVGFFWANGAMGFQSITPVGPVPDILPKDEEVPAVVAALRATKQ